MGVYGKELNKEGGTQKRGIYNRNYILSKVLVHVRGGKQKRELHMAGSYTL